MTLKMIKSILDAAETTANLTEVFRLSSKAIGNANTFILFKDEGKLSIDLIKGVSGFLTNSIILALALYGGFNESELDEFLSILQDLKIESDINTNLYKYADLPFTINAIKNKTYADRHI